MYIYRKEFAAKKELKRKALEPHERFCTLLKKRVTILAEYEDYKHSRNKGELGTIYCSNIIPCYHNNMKCKYSGISPLYQDPLEPLEDHWDELQKQASEEKSDCNEEKPGEPAPENTSQG